MARFLLDHNVDQGIARELTLRGHEADTARGRQKERASDPAIFLLAVREERIVITRDNHFAMLHDAWCRWGVMPLHFGILIIPQQWMPTRAADELTAFAATHPSLRNESWRWRGGMGWEEIDPLSDPWT